MTVENHLCLEKCTLDRGETSWARKCHNTAFSRDTRVEKVSLIKVGRTDEKERETNN